LVNAGRDFYMTASASHPPEASIPQPAFCGIHPENMAGCRFFKGALEYGEITLAVSALRQMLDTDIAVIDYRL
jgi:hypothetical protein